VRLTLDVYGTPAFGPTSRAAPQPLLEINRAAGPTHPLTAGWNALAEAMTDLATAAVQMQPAMLFPPGIGMVFLKQTPDVHDGRFAAYQAIVEARATLSGTQRGGPLYGTYELTLSKLDSHPIADDLGLQPKQPAVFAYWLDMDFVFESGTVIWEA